VNHALQLERHHTDAGLFVIAVGPLDDLNTSALLDACRDEVRIELDLLGVTFISLAGVEVLMELAQSSALTILAASPVARGAIDAAGLAHVLATNGKPCVS
jgi:anti-anti-sigma regulatory factor